MNSQLVITLWAIPTLFIAGWPIYFNDSSPRRRSGFLVGLIHRTCRIVAQDGSKQHIRDGLEKTQPHSVHQGFECHGSAGEAAALSDWNFQASRRRQLKGVTA